MRRKLNVYGLIVGENISQINFLIFTWCMIFIHERTSPYSPQSNGIAERKNRTLTELVNAMLETAEVSKEWWGEAILIACHILNRVPTKNKEITLFEE